MYSKELNIYDHTLTFMWIFQKILHHLELFIIYVPTEMVHCVSLLSPQLILVTSEKWWRGQVLESNKQSCHGHSSRAWSSDLLFCAFIVGWMAIAMRISWVVKIRQQWTLWLMTSELTKWCLHCRIAVRMDYGCFVVSFLFQMLKMISDPRYSSVGSPLVFPLYEEPIP